jgi:hypothetical protein
MEEKYKGKIRIGTLVCVFLLFASNLPLDAGMLQTANAMQHSNVRSLNQHASISLYTFEKENTRCYPIELSIDDAKEITNLIVQWVDAIRTNSSPKVMDRLQRELLSALRQHWVLPEEAIKEVLSAFSTPSAPRGHTMIPRFFHGFFPLYEKREKVVRASITSSGAGILIPMALTPRPHLTTFWIADSGKTLAIDWVTKYGYNVTGPHLGAAIGFIGVGFSSRIPNEHQYVLVGGALLAVLFGDTITQIVPSKDSSSSNRKQPL